VKWFSSGGWGKRINKNTGRSTWSRTGRHAGRDPRLAAWRDDANRRPAVGLPANAAAARDPSRTHSRVQGACSTGFLRHYVRVRWRGNGHTSSAVIISERAGREGGSPPLPLFVNLLSFFFFFWKKPFIYNPYKMVQ